MNNAYVSQNSFNFLEKPYHKFLELNIKAIKNISYITPEELFKIHNPEELFAQNMELFVNNGHTTLDYVHDVFSLMQDHWFNSFNSANQEILNVATVAAHKKIKSLKKTGEEVKKVVGSNLKTHPLVQKQNKKPATTQHKTAFHPQHVSTHSKNIGREIH